MAKGVNFAFFTTLSITLTHKSPIIKAEIKAKII